MRPGFKVVAAREVKKDLTPSYERSYSRRNAVYGDINQCGACGGEYRNKETKSGRRNEFVPPFPIPPPPPVCGSSFSLASPDRAGRGGEA
jgi:hypothetical protein